MKKVLLGSVGLELWPLWDESVLGWCLCFIHKNLPDMLQYVFTMAVPHGPLRRTAFSSGLFKGFVPLS